MIEKLSPDFAKEQFLMDKYTNYRIDKGGRRHYVRVYDDGFTILAPAFHTITDTVAPIDYGLLSWFKDMTKEDIQFYSESSANYGTFFHVCCGKILQDENFSFNLESIDQKMEKFFEIEGYDFESCKKWMKIKKRDLRKDLLGFSIFCKEYEVEPIVIEYVAMDANGLVATTLDLICKMKFEGEKVNASIDLKSSEYLTSPIYPLQLYVGKKLWEQEFPNFKIDKVFNYGVNNKFRMSTLFKFINGGKSGKFRPYVLKDQTDSWETIKWKKYMSLYYREPNNLKNVGVSMEFNEDFNLSRDVEFNNSIVVVNEIKKLSEKDLF